MLATPSMRALSPSMNGCPPSAFISATSRWLPTAAMVEFVPASHEAAYRAMPATLEVIERDRLADRVAVYARGGVQLYENTLKGGQWSRSPGAREAVEAERVRPWSSGERQDYAAGWDRVVEQMTGRGAPPEDLHHARSVRAAAYLETDVAALRRTSAQEHVELVSHARSESERAGIAVVMQDGARRSAITAWNWCGWIARWPSGLV